MCASAHTVFKKPPEILQGRSWNFGVALQPYTARQLKKKTSGQLEGKKMIGGGLREGERSGEGNCGAFGAQMASRGGRRNGDGDKMEKEVAVMKEGEGEEEEVSVYGGIVLCGSLLEPV